MSNVGQGPVGKAPSGGDFGLIFAVVVAAAARRPVIVMLCRVCGVRGRRIGACIP